MAISDANPDTSRYDAVVIGGGSAGLQAALTLGRVHRRTLLLDGGTYRNDPATHMHNFLGHDGTPPAELRAAARKDLAAYETVTVRDTTVTAVAAEGDGFRVHLGDEEVSTRGLILATGVRDTLPDKPGIPELFGDLVAHCPFCHGHEFAGRPVALLGDGTAHLQGIMGPVASSVTGLDVDTVASLERSGDGVRVHLEDGSSQEYAGVFVSTALTQAAPFAEQLGLRTLPSGCVEVDVLQRTSLPGVHAAGDMAHHPDLGMPMASVLTAAASGMVAGAAMVAYLM
ncbi:NAD(P)/FAD-dependent oxidoreductase [Nocardioides mangrovi]|uniref:NAD(P)/FAD-dependent oxidoreductase n=1 Tax=Nocardioides mangrovi TaxID=2874580 RepID=A0ABS7UBN8_9ACTN|nr:NAD(P)/FAD-dependent oxidoreductase [Nocardioides mangrovi]MBZ5738088.1 NAD(P)/FAD-dependent oxidoreductase [Nocardioides mangrovi]